MINEIEVARAARAIATMRENTRDVELNLSIEEPVAIKQLMLSVGYLMVSILEIMNVLDFSYVDCMAMVSEDKDRIAKENE